LLCCTAGFNRIRYEEARPIFGCIGIIRLLAGRYLIVILDCSKVGTIDGEEIYFVTKTGIVPIPRHTAYLSEDEIRLERQYCNMLNNFLANSGFYFSYTFDLTHSTQRRSSFPIIEDELQRRAHVVQRVWIGKR
jgi:phosphatidylinositol 4-phosphatase